MERGRSSGKQKKVTRKTRRNLSRSTRMRWPRGFSPITGRSSSLQNGAAFSIKCVFKNESEVDFTVKSSPNRNRPSSAAYRRAPGAGDERFLEAVKEASEKKSAQSRRAAARRPPGVRTATTERSGIRDFIRPQILGRKRQNFAPRRRCAKAMPINEQVAKVLEWESRRLWFSNDFRNRFFIRSPRPALRSIFLCSRWTSSSSPKNAVRDILAHHGWFQTVKSDLPHFTYLGLTRDELPKSGLKSVLVGGQEFWIPNLD